MKTTSAAVAIEHGWKKLKKDKAVLMHAKFPEWALRIETNNHWHMRSPVKKGSADFKSGNTPKALLDFLTKFHQTTFHGMTASKLVKEEKKNAKYAKLAPAIERQLKGQRELEEFRATDKQPKQPKLEPDIKNLTPRVEQGFFLQGPVKFAIDADDIFKTLSCGAYGIGQVRAREGILANLGETELKRWAEVNGLPTKPFARELLIEALRGILQNAFYFTERDGLVPLRCVENQARRMQEFKAKFEAFAKTATVKAERLQASLKSNGGQHVFVKKEECTWAATEKLTKKLVAELKGQQQPILEWLLKNKGTRTEIAAAVASRLTTKQKPELVVGHYLPEWKKKGLISSL